MLQKKKKRKKKESCWLNILFTINTYITKCNKINDHAFCYVSHLFNSLKCWNWQMLNRHMRHFSFWHSLIKVWRYMVKCTTNALRKTECACWKVDNTGFVGHWTEEAWLTVSNVFCESSSFGCFSNFHLIISLWFSNFKNNTLFLIFKQLGDNCIQNVHLGRYIVGYMVGNFVLRRRVSGAVKRNFRPYNRWYTSPNDHFEYGYPHSNALF